MKKIQFYFLIFTAVFTVGFVNYGYSQNPCQGSPINPTSLSFTATQTTSQSVSINRNSGCTGTVNADSPATWINIQPSGETIIITVQPNTGSARQSTVFITIGGNSSNYFTVSQAGSPPPPTPSTTISITNNNCGSATLNRSGTPPNGVAWYWQTTSNGVSTAYSASTFPVTSNGTYYLRAKGTASNGQWSTSSKASPIVSLAQFTGGSVSYSGGSTTLCYGGNPATINNTVAASGGTTYSYQWQSATSQNGTYSNISGATSASYDPPSLTSTRWYQRRVTSCGGETRLSNKVAITILPQVAIATGSDQSRCGSGSITLTATPGANANTVRWYAAATGGSVLTTGINYTTPTLGTTTTYYAESYNSTTGCRATTRKSVTAQIQATATWYLDADNDGFHAGIITDCTSPGAGYTSNVKQPGDCNDSNPSLNPNTVWYLDADNDGFHLGTQTQCTSPGSGYTTTVKQPGDCNDSNPSLNPNTVWYLDADNDGFYAGTQTQCASPGSGYTTTVKQPGDCNDADPALNPNTIWYADEDQDGYADDGGATVQQCNEPAGNWTLNSEQNPCGVSAAEKQALLDLYNSTNGDNWTNTLAGNQPWDTNIPVCDWYGVTVTNGLITGVNLNNTGLSGNLPATLGNLSNLTEIYLIGNNLSGSIPVQLGNLSNLEYLYLYFNNLSGSIPLELGNLSNLKNLYLYSNNLSGGIPSELGNLLNLEFLSLSDNQFTGSIPPQLGNLSKLQGLSLDRNQLTGSIPNELGSLLELKRLNFNTNVLTGTIPSVLGDLADLEILRVSNNQLTGSIPVEIANLAQLKDFWVSNNSLDGDIPFELAGLTNLNVLEIRNNNFVFTNFEDVHATFQNILSSFNYRYSPQANVDREETLSVPENESITLTSMDLASPNNSYQWYKDGVAIAGATNKDYVISNATPADAGVYYFAATNSIVTGLTLTRNNITVTIDPPIDTCGVAETEKQALLDLYNSTNGDNWTNTLAGNQPWDTNIPVCDWFGVTVVNGSVTAIQLGNNNLTGPIPLSLGDLSSLVTLRLHSNNLNGTIPTSLGSLTQLRTLYCRINQLTGVLPPELGNLSQLQILDFSSNNLSGDLPSVYGDLSNLRGLELNNNLLTGTIPISYANLSSLLELKLSQNQLTGTIPAEFGNMSQLEQLWLQNNQLTGMIPSELGTPGNVLDDLSLAGNQLTGIIPPELGNLVNLRFLSLSNNQLTGSIPFSLASLTDYVTVNFNSNNLSGVVPSFTNALTMSFFGIANNEFVFSNFENDHTFYDTNVNGYLYNPQASVDIEESLSVPENENITLTSAVLTSPNNSYQWFKDGVAIAGATSKDYIISNATPADAGVYYFEAINSVVTGLTLTRNNITVTIDPPIDTCGVSETEKQALLDLYNSTNGDNWTNTLAGNQPWDTNVPVCDWFGVTVVNGKITKLELSENNLTGSISNSIGSLIWIEWLNLSRNSIQGSIPSEIGNILPLQYLFLQTNQLNGAIPDEIGNLSSLVTLSLFANDLSGEIPSEMSNLLSLRTLYLGGNELTGSIPPWLGSLSELRDIRVYQNNFTGFIPVELSSLTNLITLQLYGNSLSGEIPSELGNITTLVNLELFNNELSSSIPTSLLLPPLAVLSVFNNNLSGPIPDFTGSTSLIRLQIRANEFVFSDFETEHSSYLSNIATYWFSPQAKVDLEENLSVPENESITLTSTDLTSPNNSYQWYKDGVAIPGATSKDYVISNATAADAGVYYFEATNSVVTGLTLTRNNITVTIDPPIDTCGVSAAEKQALLDLYNSTNGDNWTNTLAGNQPWDTNIPVCDWFGVTVVNDQVTEIKLENNNLIGSIPNTIDALTELRRLNLFTNQLSGAIPDAVGNLTELRYLFLNENALSGNIPEVLGNLTNLIDLVLNDNELDGEIPIQLSNLQNLRDINLLRNQLTGSIPSEFGNFSATLFRINVSGNQLEGRIPPSILNLSGLTNFKFDRNKFIFSDFEPEFLQYQTNSTGEFGYQPQAKVDLVENVSVLENGSITLTSTALTSPNNSYQWFKDGLAITGATSKDYVISNATPADAGVYYFEAINSVVTGLTLTRNNITVTIDPPIDTCGVSATEKQALLDLYNSTNGDNWTNTLAGNQPWDTNIPVCDWFGVTVVNDRVTKVQISNNSLSGPIPNTISNLIFLTNLALNNNSLSGNIPSSLGDMTTLEELQLNNNTLNGIIPVSLGNLTNLKTLWLYANNFTGEIPLELGNLLNLQSFHLANNNLSGVIPNEIGNLLQLTYLNVGNNNLIGEIPITFANLTSLVSLWLWQNEFSGSVPNFIGNLTNLKQLVLYRNNFSGILPTSLGDINSLNYVRIYENSFSGAIPFDVINQANFSLLDFKSNNYVFADFENVHLSYLSDINTYVFSPQAKVDQEEALSVPENGTISLSSLDLTSPNNSYQWFKDGVAIPGATSKDYVISNATAADAGVYYFEATNSVVTGLTLTRNNITLSVESGPQIIVQEFCTMNGQPTLEDIVFATINGFPADWYLTETGGSVLPFTTLLQEGVTYWADDTQDGSNARVPHEVIIDKDIPLGNIDQSFDFTANPTVSDIVVQAPNGAGIIWYSSVNATTPLPDTTPLVDGQSYYALADIAGVQCRLQITVNDTNPTEICIDVLVEGSGGTSIIDGSFESANGVIIANNRNESLGASGWGATQGTPDTFSIPYANTNDPYLRPFYRSSSDGGICAGGLKVANTTESFASNILNLESGATYIVEFYQANVSNVISQDMTRESNGFWKVEFGNVVKSSKADPAGVYDAFWTRQQLEFTALSGTQSLEFEVGSFATDQTNAYPVYMLIDGIRVYKKPESTISTVCYAYDIQEFCTSQFGDPTFADLNAPNGGAVSWYSEPTGGQLYFDNDELLELRNAIVWADDGSGSPRTAVEIVLNLGAPEGDEYQTFDIATGPTIADIQVTGDNITWHDAPSGGATLSSSTTLVDGAIYYAAQNGNNCRLDIEVFVGVPNPIGSGYQEFCSSENPTVGDLVMNTTSGNYTIFWYSSLEGGNALSIGEVLIDGNTYYAEQSDGINTNDQRSPVKVSVIDVDTNFKTYERDIEVPIGSSIQDLTAFFELNLGSLWYDVAQGGTVYSNNYALIDGETYYARIGEGLCKGSDVLAVTIQFADVVAPELITCIKFIPQPGSRYVISGWVREDALIAQPAGTAQFSDVKDVFIELLDHLTSKILNKEEIPDDEYVLASDTDAPNVDALLPYIKNFTGKNVTVYNFDFETENINGLEKSVGYSFALDPDNTYRFVYRTPEVLFEFGSFAGSGLNPIPRGYHYPLRNYEGLDIEYTDVSIVGNKFRITSNFKVPATVDSGIKFNYANQTSDSNTDSGINNTIQLFNYTEEPGYQVMDYLNTTIELSYKGTDGSDLPQAPANAVFEPKGSIIDGWQRISSDFTIPVDAAYMRITLRNSGDALNAYFDDVRMHPFDSNMKSFVYDPVTQRLQAELDENNYATFYEYDKEGGLVRVKKETERGVFTIQETRSGNSKLNHGSE